MIETKMKTTKILSYLGIFYSIIIEVAITILGFISLFYPNNRENGIVLLLFSSFLAFLIISVFSARKILLKIAVILSSIVFGYFILHILYGFASSEGNACLKMAMILFAVFIIIVIPIPLTVFFKYKEIKSKQMRF